MELTREQAIAEHRKMWRWLAEHPDAGKDDYLKEAGIDADDLRNGCFLCAYAEMERQKANKIDRCYCCPLDWGGRGCIEAEDYSLYSEWVFYGEIFDYDGCAKVARQIAELPERTEE